MAAYRGRYFERPVGRDSDNDDRRWFDDLLHSPARSDARQDEFGRQRRPAPPARNRPDQRRRRWGHDNVAPRHKENAGDNCRLPRMTQDGEAISAVELVGIASGARDHHARELCNVILRTLTRRGWVFATEPLGWETPSSVVQAGDVAQFLAAAANAIGGSPFGARLRCYHKTPAYEALLDHVDRTRRDYAARSPPAQVPASHHLETFQTDENKGHSVERSPRPATPPQQQQQIAPSHVAEQALPLGNPSQHTDAIAAVNVSAAVKHAPAETASAQDKSSGNAEDDGAWHRKEQDAGASLDYREAERDHNETLVERMASVAHTDRPLCVWRHSDGVWALVFAVRPGAHPRRPWRVVAGHRAALGLDEQHATHARDDTDNNDDGVWIDRAKVIERACHALCSPANVVAAAPSPALEPPLCDDPDAVGFDSTWAHVTALCCLDQMGRGCASTHVPHALVVHLAARLVEASAHDTPHAARCRDLADALSARLGHNGSV
ncbi:hypothetical protein pmac_cds_18 [Pandoravirus macleodensis]|uniref:Uncharacterized protein n=1 Tax=Pandoravirus macleodensis TaxID=2107707 RepID=A0A2U7UE41_9VIRU|nr:hypothetical protein pmac_cds_18 [Pandoravirus macleodensis]AVK76706.1 hypothetical protein pmac_cds_18 [Pandoravirus macleodensis]